MTIKNQMNDVIHVIKKTLNNNLLGIYMFGSYVEGNLQCNSDLDFLVVVSETITDGQRQTLIKEIMPYSRSIGDANHLRYVELTVLVQTDYVVWSYPPIQDFLYGEWLRDDYHMGYLPKRKSNPDLAVVLYQATKNNLKLYGDKDLNEFIPSIPFNDVEVAMRHSLSDLIKNFEGDESNVILTLRRMIVTRNTEDIVSKDIAGDMICKTSDSRYQNIIKQAIAQYQGESMPWDVDEVGATINYLVKLIEDTIK